MKIGFPLYFELVKLALFPGSENRGRTTLKRFVTLLAIIPALCFGRILHSIAFLLDDLFFPGYRNIEVKEPVFVVGIARSGTTLLHRLLAKDADKFTAFMFWELLLAPSIVERKFWFALGRVDRALGGWGRKLLRKVDAVIFADFREMHHLSLFQPEEDEWVLFHILASAFLVFLFPSPEAVAHLIRFDETALPAHKKRIMAFHKRCVQRHLYVHGPEKRLLSKNPTFSAKIDSLNETYPGAKIVCCVRNPYEAVPSLMSLLSFILKLTDNQGREDETRAMTLEVAAHFYRHPMARLPHLPENRHSFVTYGKLTTEPKAAVAGLYEKFGFEMNPEYARQLDAEQAKIRAYKSAHTYSLADYDLSAEGLFEDFRDVFEHYGFSREYPG